MNSDTKKLTLDGAAGSGRETEILLRYQTSWLTIFNLEVGSDKASYFGSSNDGKRYWFRYADIVAFRYVEDPADSAP